MKKIKLGILGCGKIFDKHFKAINDVRNLNNFELISVCDTDKNKTKKIKNSNILKYNNYKDFFRQNSNLDLISICTPSGLHYEHCKMAAKRKINVLVEKPLTLKFNQSLELNNIFNKKKLNLFVVKQNRFNKTLILLKKIIQKNLLGQIYLVNLNVFWHRPQKYYDKDAWRGDKFLDGGAIFNQASHHIDILNWLFGKTIQISCVTSTLGRKIQTEDTALINMRNKNGTLISTNVTVLSYRKNYECTMNIISEKGNIKIGGPALNKFDYLDVKNIKQIKKLFKENGYNKKNFFYYGHEDVYEAIFSDINNKTQKCPTSKNTIETIKLIENFHNSNNKRKHIIIR